jgi:hypothetical protein
MRLDVWPDGAEESTLVEVAPRTILQWEKANRGRSAVQLDDNAWRLEYLYEIAYIAMDKPTGDFDKFCDTTDVTWAQSRPATKDTSVDPIQPDQPTDA